VFFDASAESKVNQFGYQIFIQNNILKFDIPMRNLPNMQIFKSFSQCFDDAFATILRRPMVGLVFEIAVERYSLEILHYDVQVVVGFNNV